MTIASTANENNYIGSDSTDTFSYAYKIFAETDLLVTQRDASDIETTLVLNTDYTVTGVKETDGGTIVLTAGNLATGFALSIKRVRPITQITQLRNLGDMFPETLEDSFDHFIMIMQFLDNNISRAISIPETTTNFDSELTEPEALKWSRVNAAGTGYEWVDAADFSSLMTTVNASLTLDAGELSITNPVRFGVAGGTVDAITLAVSPAPASLTNNLRVYFEALGANTSVAPTLDVDGLGTKTIVKGNNLPLLAGDIPGANARGDVIFDSSLDKWILLNPAFGVSIIKTKIIEISSWNMDATGQIDVTHGLTLANIRGISVIIRNDADTQYLDFPTYSVAGTTDEYAYADATNITLLRSASGYFDSAAFDATSYNRGWITITYV